MNRLLVLVFLSFHLLVSQANANQDPLQSELKAQRVVVQEDGKEKFESATQATPGDILQYTLVYKNVGKSSLSGIIVQGPIPQGTHYVPASAKTLANAKLEATIDNGENWAPFPLFRQIKHEDGSMRDTEVHESESTAIRWKLNSPLAANQSINFTYRIRINE